MSIAIKELLRQPKRFLPVAGALTLLVVLLVVLGGFLDGLEKSQTGAYRAHQDSVIVYDAEAKRQLSRSRVSTDDQATLAEQSGVERVGRLDATFTVAGLDGALEDVILFGYDLSTEQLPDPPPAGSVVVDEQLARVMDVKVGDQLDIGPDAVPLTVAVLVDDLTNGAPSLWVSADEWRGIAVSANPSALLGEGEHQALVAQSVDGDAEALAAELNQAGLDGLEPITANEAILALDVVQQQSSTFSGIIGVTFVITLIVIALFFALITLERVSLYAVLKAIGARSGELLAGVSVQAVGISIASLIAGFGLSLLFVSLLPPELPIRLELARLVQIAVGTVVTALVGSLFTARRLLRIDPASAIG